MNSVEAFNVLMSGKKVRNKEWVKDAYLYYDEKSLTIKDNNDNSQLSTYFDEYFSSNQWELYKEDERRNTMNFEEARRELLDGKKVRCVDWSKGIYIYFDDKNLVTKDNNGVTQQHVYDLWRKREWELYEEPKKVFKVFISQPMQGKTKCEIYEERDKIKKAIEKKYGKKYQIEYLNEDWNTRPKDWSRIQNLGYSIMNMYDANIVVFAPNWNEAEGCIIEHNVAFYCEKKFYVCVVQDNEYNLR